MGVVFYTCCNLKMSAGFLISVTVITFLNLIFPLHRMLTYCQRNKAKEYIGKKNYYEAALYLYSVIFNF